MPGSDKSSSMESNPARAAQAAISSSVNPMPSIRIEQSPRVWPPVMFEQLLFHAG
jgi:hypothetical protein